ncbi:protein-disulfide reductase DsbD domain-containing protein [Pararhizobium sp. O133]|uniref:protein-disulfide reductase DsbD domain-containing protein n=1 Tax=Pararhizobium sp. O133 TaxID=3449278 RepID=UPI003F684D02
MQLHVLATLAGYFFAASIAHAATSEWVGSEGGDVRIVAAKPQSDGTIPAILDIRLKPGWKTYWLEPGASGIPPQVSIDPSSGITFSGLSFPAPKAFDDGVVRYTGYDQSVAFPLSLKSETKGDLTLKGSIFLGICKDICIPVQGSFSVPLPAAQVENPLERARIDKAVSTLPQVPSDDFKVTAATFDTSDKRLRLSVTAPGVTAKAPAELFLSGPSGYGFGKPDNIVTENGVTSVEIPVRIPEKGGGLTDGSVLLVVRVGDRSMQTTLAFD